MRRRYQIVSVLMVLFPPPVVVAQGVDCGEPPPVANEEMKVEIEGNAKLLTGLLGQADLSGHLEKSRTEVFSSYPNADKVVLDRYFFYQICVYLRDDDSMTNFQKIEKLVKIKHEFDNPVPITEGPTQQQRYWYRFGLNSFSCDLALPISKTQQEEYGRQESGFRMPPSLGPFAVMGTIRDRLTRAIFHNGRIMTFYSCDFDRVNIRYECMKRSVYTNESGEQCARFECETNDAKRKEVESILGWQQRILCERVNGELYDLSDSSRK